MKKFHFLFTVFLAISVCCSCSKSPEDVVSCIYKNLDKKEYNNVVEYVFPDSVGEITESDIEVFTNILDGNFFDVQYSLQEIVSCELDSTGNFCNFEIKTTLKNGKSYNEKGRLYKSANEKWLLDLNFIESETPSEETDEAIPNINAAVVRTLAAKGIPQFQVAYHRLVEDGVYFNDKVEAFTNVQKAAKQGYPEGMRCLAWDYYNGFGTEEDKEQAFEWYLKAAEKGDLFSIDKVSRAYLNGNGVIKDVQKAFEWAKKGAEKNYGRSMDILGYMYDYGIGVEQNYEEANKLYMKNAEINNYDESIYSIAYNYYLGRGFEKDEKEAFKWSLKAAELGYADAQNFVGYFYENGYGDVDINYDAAINWYKKAANQNNDLAQYNLGMMYYNGKGVARNYETAADWFRKAAKQGNSGAKDMVDKLWRY